MRGLRCDPALLGWTRLLDEWVVAPSPVASDLDAERRALAEAATRVRSFAFADAQAEPTEPLADGTLRFELQGRVYRLALGLVSADSMSALQERAELAFAATTAAVTVVTERDEHPVAALAVTLSGTPSGAFLEASREIPCDACGFSFLGPETGRVLLVRASAPMSDLSS